MVDKNIKKIDIRDTLALCEIIDNFDRFNKEIIDLASKTKTSLTNLMYEVWKVSDGAISYSRKANKFYKDYKSIIESISKYNSICSFVNMNYDNNGILIDEKLGFSYQYILDNKEHIEKIKELLERIKELGFSEVYFDEKLDVSDKEYCIYTGNQYGEAGKYVDNIELIPTYDNTEVKYKSNGTNFVIDIYSRFGHLTGEKITVNSLLFDKDRLPKHIDKENIIKPFTKFTEEQKGQYQGVRNSTNLSVGISDLECELLCLEKTITLRLEDVYNKEELLKVLTNIKEEISKLTSLNSEYNQSIISKYPNVTEKVLADEVKLYIKRREDSKIDLC